MRKDWPRARPDTAAATPRIGNDIVSRENPWPRSSDHLERYRRRVLTPNERARAGDSELALWMCWAVKESTYKLEFAADPRPSFRPKAIECLSIRRSANGLYRTEVRGRHGIYPGWLRVEPAFVHALVAESPATLAASIWRDVRLSCGTPREQSAEIERRLQSLLRSAGLLGPRDAFELHRTPQPGMRRNGRPCGGVSLSHHGRWGGIAVTAGPSSRRGSDR